MPEASGVPDESITLRKLAGQPSAIAFMNKLKTDPFMSQVLRYKLKQPRTVTSFLLNVGDNRPHDMCYDVDRNVIYVVCYQNPVRLLTMNPDTFAYTAISIVTPNPNSLGYRVAYDGTSIWVTTSGSVVGAGSLIQVNPNTGLYSQVTFPNDGNHNYSNSIYVHPSGLIFCGAGSHLIVVNPLTWPAYTDVDLTLAGGWLNGNTVREIVFDGQLLWMSGDGAHVSTVDPVTLNVVNVANLAVPLSDIYSGYFDGSYLWWGGHASKGIVKMNLVTFAYEECKIQLGTGIIHRFASDGRYLYCVDYTNGMMFVIHPETLEYLISPVIAAPGLHACMFDGTYIWTCNGNEGGATPGTVFRYLVQEPSRKWDHGTTATFAIDAIAVKTVAVSFDVPFKRVPDVVVQLNGVTDTSVVIGFVDAVTVTVNGFTARCKVLIAAGGGATATLSWVATERSLHWN